MVTTLNTTLALFMCFLYNSMCNYCCSSFTCTTLCFFLLYQTWPGSRSAAPRKPGGFWELGVATKASPALISTRTPVAGRSVLEGAFTYWNLNLIYTRGHSDRKRIAYTATASFPSVSCTSTLEQIQARPCTSASKFAFNYPVLISVSGHFNLYWLEIVKVIM